MNSVALIGNLVRDPEIRYNGDDESSAMTTFTIAIDRPPKKDGTKQTDFPRITVFGRQAVNCEKYLAKGKQVGIVGRIQTGSYVNKNGDKVYTTDIVADRVEFLSKAENVSERDFGGYGNSYQQAPQNPPQRNVQAQNSAWEAIGEEDIPF